ncbi:MAG: hypothetical protein AAB353_14135 [Candidatus Hydrogenedentota bacterium]
MAQALLTDVVSHWYHLFEGTNQSTQEFYARLEQALKERAIPDATFGHIEIKEGGLLSAKRLYLRIWRKKHVFDICGATFGKGFFVSWWLSELPSGCLAFLSSIPVVNVLTWWLAKPVTYYKIDTALMFQQYVHSAVLEVLDAVTTAKGVRALSESERKPIMRDFFHR